MNNRPGGRYQIDPKTGDRTLVEQTQQREITRLDDIDKSSKQPSKTAVKQSGKATAAVEK